MRLRDLVKNMGLDRAPRAVQELVLAEVLAPPLSRRRATAGGDELMRSLAVARAALRGHPLRERVHAGRLSPGDDHPGGRG